MSFWYEGAEDCPAGSVSTTLRDTPETFSWVRETAKALVGTSPIGVVCVALAGELSLEDAFSARLASALGDSVISFTLSAVGQPPLEAAIKVSRMLLEYPNREVGIVVGLRIDESRPGLPLLIDEALVVRVDI